MWMNKILRLDARWTDALRLKNPETNRFKPFAAFFAHSGDSWFIEVALFILWLVTRGEVHKLIALLAGAIVVLALLVLAIKFTIRRQRPQGDWGAIYRNTDPHSFPSGHAARTAMMSTVAFLMGFPILGIVFAVWAILVSLARVWMGVHYLSDIIAGMILGILFGIFAALTSAWYFALLPWVFSDRSSLIRFK